MEALGAVGLGFALFLVLFFGAFIFGGRSSFIRSFFVGFLIGRFWKVFLVIILVIAVLLGISYAAYSFDMNSGHIRDVLERDILPVVIPIVVSLILGVVFGLIPYFTGRYCAMNGLGKQGLKWSILTGIILPVSFVIAIVFTVLIIRRYRLGNLPGEFPEEHDSSNGRGIPDTARATYPAVRCLTGPFAGNIYEITEAGVTMGRNPMCTVIYPRENTAVSRYHCTVYRHHGMLVLTDAGSMNGTFTADGEKIHSRTPVYVTVGMTFYLGDRNNAFEIILAQ